MKKVEILAPGGSIEGIRAALNCGADAVYAGGQMFGARAYAGNPEEAQLIDMIREVHHRGKKLYLTVNTLLKEQELYEKLIPYLKPYYEAGLDAVLVQDLGVWRMIRAHFPDLPLHVSTQMNLMSAASVAYMKQQGATRIVPGRELSLAEIRAIKAACDIEIETFVHGALCYCYSGQCLMSSMIGGRSGNRGRCAQPCRLPYRFEAQGKAVNKEAGQYLLSPKDICTLKMLPDLIDAGIDSFKIEGRMKKPEYAACVSGLYRKYADLYLTKGREGYHVAEEDLMALSDLYNRGGFSEGYYKQHNGKEMMSVKRPNHYGIPAGKVIKLEKNRFLLEALTDLHGKDVLEFFELSTGVKSAEWSMKCAVKAGEALWITHPYFRGLKEGMICNRTRNEQLISEIAAKESQNHYKHLLHGRITIEKGKPISLTVCDDEITVTVTSDQCPQGAINRAVDEKDVEKQIFKTGDTPYAFSELEILLEPGLFVPVNVFNTLRREALARFTECVDEFYQRSYDDEAHEALKVPEVPEAAGEDSNALRLSVLVTTEAQLQAVLNMEAVERIYVDYELLLSMHPLGAHGKQVFIAMPHVFRDEFEAQNDRLLSIGQHYDGYLARNLETIMKVKAVDPEAYIIADACLYAWNRPAKQQLYEAGCSEVTIPEELNGVELMHRDCTGDEMLVYGRRPLMISAQCVLQTNGQCLKAHGRLKAPYILIDRKNHEMPVVPRCGFCYNIIYNSQVFDLTSDLEKVSEIGPGSIRVELIDESPEESKRIIEGLKLVMETHGDSPWRAESGYTRGHFKRGVE